MKYGAQGTHAQSPSMGNSMASMNFQMGTQGQGTEYQTNRGHNQSTNSYGQASGRNTQSQYSQGPAQNSMLSIGGPQKTNTSSIQTNQSKQKNEVIKVCIRVRPLLRNELHMDEIVYYPESDDPSLQGIRIADGQHYIESKYDRVFNQYTHQNEIFDFVRSNIEDVLNGFNSTIFAYGQTGSGKTFTMFGPHWDDNMGHQNTMGGLGGSFNSKRGGGDPFLSDQQQFGIIPRSIEHLFRGLAEMQSGTEQGFTVYCSFLQIYNEKLFDLFQDKESGKALNIREDKYTGIFVEGQSEYVVTTAHDCFTLLKRGEANRITRQTRSNVHSSRSHTIFQILVESDTADSRGLLFRGKLNLCDLAGSEKIQKDESMNTQHFHELKTINQSLSSLGKVITALAQGKKKDHIPYRDSKITRLLQDSLGGNTKTTLIAACNSKSDCVSETISTLKFADRAKQIMVKVSANTVSAADDALVIKLQKEVQHLKEILNLNRKGGVLDVHQQLLVLKEENSKLKDAAHKVSQVERLKAENKMMRIELQEMKAQGMSEGFKQIGFQSGAGGYGGQAQQSAAHNMSVDHAIESQPMLAIQPEAANSGSPTKGGGGGFFLTETEQFNNYDQQSPRGIAPQQPQTVQKQSSMPSNGNRAYNDSLQQQEMALIQHRELSSTIDSKRSHQFAPSTHGGQAGGALPQNHQGHPQSIQQNQNLSYQQIYDKHEQQRLTEIKAKAVSMKGTLANKGRCPVCTLKPPCKHFESMEALIGSTTQGSQQSFTHQDITQATPERGLFYPSKDLSQVSITTGSIHDKHQRSDGFSVNSSLQQQSHQQQSGSHLQNFSRGLSGTPASIKGGQKSETLQSSGAAILNNRNSQQNQIPSTISDNRVTSPVERQTPSQYGKPPLKPYNQNPVQVLDSLVKPTDEKNQSKASNFELKTSALSQIFAEQDALQKQLLARVNKPDTPPKPTSQALTKQQINNIMKSGPDSQIQEEVKPQIPEMPKDYDEELRQQKMLIQKQIDALKDQMTANENAVSNIQNLHTENTPTPQIDSHYDLRSPQSVQSYQQSMNQSKLSASEQMMPYAAPGMSRPPLRANDMSNRDTGYSAQPMRNQVALRTPQHNMSLHNSQPTSDKIEVRIRGKNNFIEKRTGSVSKTLGEIDQKRKQKRDLSQATQRLKVLEQLEQYREEKVAQEMMILEIQRQQQEEQIQKQIAADKKKQAYLEKQKIKLKEYQAKKSEDDRQLQMKAQNEKQMQESQRKKFLKEQENKKKQIAEYKRKKLEAEEMLANADLPEYDEYDNDELDQSYQQNMVKSYTKDTYKQTKPQIQSKQNARQLEQDDEDRYLDEILNKNYSAKPPPAIN